MRMDMNEFDDIAKKLWFVDGATVKLVKRTRVEQRLLSLYGASVDLSASEENIKAALEKIQHHI